MKGWRWEVGGSEGSSGLVVSTFGEMTVAFPSSERKREGGEDGSNVSVESLESCRFSGFSLWLLSLLSSLCLSAMADCVICINESWRKEMVISFSVSFSFSISQSVILKDFIFLSLTSLLYSYNTPSLPLLSLSSSVSLPPADRLESNQQGSFS